MNSNKILIFGREDAFGAGKLYMKIASFKKNQEEKQKEKE